MQIADDITVEFVNGESVPATVVASEVKTDLALLQIARVPAGIAPAVLGDSSTEQVGEPSFVFDAARLMRT